MRPEGLGNLIKIFHLIGSRTRDLPVCNIAPYILLINVWMLHIQGRLAPYNVVINAHNVLPFIQSIGRAILLFSKECVLITRLAAISC
jgi:hypothetical protein